MRYASFVPTMKTAFRRLTASHASVLPTLDKDQPDIEEIKFMYRVFLGRDLESSEVYDTYWRGADWRECLSRFTESLEFQRFGALRYINIDATLYGKTRYGFVMPVSLIEPLTILSYIKDDFELNESNFIHSALTEGDFAVDLGARHGWFTGVMAAKVGQDGHVFSFEPSPPMAGVKQLAEINGFSNISMFASGVSDVPGQVCFDHQRMTIAETGAGVIPLTTLDIALADRRKKIRLIKADIEGAEPLAFRGAEQILRTDRPALVFEVHRERMDAVSRTSGRDLMAWLKSVGYRSFTTPEGADAGPEVFDADLTNVIATF